MRRWHIGGWAMWSIAALFYAYEFIHRVAPSIFTNQLRMALSINDQQLGTIGAMYFYAYAAFQLPAGILIDRYGTKKLLVIASSVLTIGSFLFATTDSASVAKISRFMIGAGSAFAFVGCLKIGAQWVSMRSFPLVVGLTNLFGTLGALSGGAPLAFLISKIGWREALMQISFAGLLITILLWLFIEDKPLPDGAEQAQPPLLTGLWIVIKSRYSWILALYGGLLVAPIAAIPEMWGVEYLKIAYGIPETLASSITHTIFIGTALGGPLIGWLMITVEDKIDFMMLATLGALVLLSIFIYWINMPLINLYLILFFYGMLTANMLLCFSLMTQYHPPLAQGAAIGFTNMIIMAIAGLAQHSVGWVLNKMQTRHAGLYVMGDYHIALSMLPFCLVIAISLTLLMSQVRTQYD